MSLDHPIRSICITLKNVAREKWGFHKPLRGKRRFQSLSPFSDSYEIYSKQQLSHFQERIQKEKEQVGIVLSVGMFAIATEKKIFMQRETFLPIRAC